MFYRKFSIELHANVRTSTYNGASFQLRGSGGGRGLYNKQRRMVQSQDMCKRICQYRTLLSTTIPSIRPFMQLWPKYFNNFPSRPSSTLSHKPKHSNLTCKYSRSHSPYNFHINLEEKYDSHGCHFF